jgi:hypothetical protein
MGSSLELTGSLEVCLERTQIEKACEGYFSSITLKSTAQSGAQSEGLGCAFCYLPKQRDW